MNPSLQQSITNPARFGLRQKSGYIFVPLIILIFLLVPSPSGLSQEGWYTGGIALVMAVLWITETIPIPVTALIPLVLFPISGAATVKEASAPYANPLIFLFMSGFIIALAMQRWNLHRRIAMNIIGMMGAKPNRVIAGFMLATALLSMWVSNTATVLMMFPVGLSVISLISNSENKAPASGKAGPDNFSIALMLGIAYSASIGGVGTLIGTPPNALMAGFLSEQLGVEIGFGQWMYLGIPLVLVTLPLCHVVLTKLCFRTENKEVPEIASIIQKEKDGLGRFSGPERMVALVASSTASLWIFKPFVVNFLPSISDTTIGMMGVLALFLIPVDMKKGSFLMDWEEAKKLPWGVLILFGGGLSLAGAIQQTGLASYIGSLTVALAGMPFWVVVVIIVTCILFLTELTSNTATTATFLPVVAAVATGMGESPVLLVIASALVASCAFMLPVATPPNAVVFGSGRITVPQMAFAGFFLNMLFLILVPIFMFVLGVKVFGIE